MKSALSIAARGPICRRRNSVRLASVLGMRWGSSASRSFPKATLLRLHPNQDLLPSEHQVLIVVAWPCASGGVTGGVYKARERLAHAHVTSEDTARPLSATKSPWAPARTPCAVAIRAVTGPRLAPRGVHPSAQTRWDPGCPQESAAAWSSWPS